MELLAYVIMLALLVALAVIAVCVAVVIVATAVMEAWDALCGGGRPHRPRRQAAPPAHA
jgi:hypothetical protein